VRSFHISANNGDQVRFPSSVSALPDAIGHEAEALA
jgi:hypothetical protein